MELINIRIGEFWYRNPHEFDCKCY